MADNDTQEFRDLLRQIDGFAKHDDVQARRLVALCPPGEVREAVAGHLKSERLTRGAYATAAKSLLVLVEGAEKIMRQSGVRS